jgi:DnaJ-class molecular chaperone
VRDHYETMMIHAGATAEQVKAKWRELSRLMHPDRFVRMSAKVQSRATEDFAAVSYAYSVLGDAKKRAAYDAERMTGHDACDACKGRGQVPKSRGLGPREYAACPQCLGSGRVPAAPARRRR